MVEVVWKKKAKIQKEQLLRFFFSFNGNTVKSCLKKRCTTCLFRFGEISTEPRFKLCNRSLETPYFQTGYGQTIPPGVSTDLGIRRQGLSLLALLSTNIATVIKNGPVLGGNNSTDAWPVIRNYFVRLRIRIE